MTLQDIPPEHEVFQSQYGEDIIGVNAIDCQQSFKQFRRTIRPKMKWGWMVDAVTHELQGFYNAFVAGKRPKWV